MKFITTLSCLFVALGSTAAMAQLPSTTGTAAPAAAPIQHSLMLDVQNKSAGGGIKHAGSEAIPNPPGTTAGSTATNTATQTKNHSDALQVTIRNLGKVADQVQVEWYFFGRPVTGRNVKDSIFDSGNKTVTIQAAGTETFEIDSKVAQSVNTTINRATVSTTGTNGPSVSYSTMETKSGTKISGWLVRMVASDGKVLDARGSEFKYEDAAKNPDKFNALKSGR